MLRLEKKKSHEILVSIRPKKIFFNYLFCIAFGWALSIHLMGLFIFHIAPIKINYCSSVFPPVIVASDLGKNGNTLVLLEEDIQIPTHILLPSDFFYAASGKPPETPVRISTDSHKGSSLQENLFADAEQYCLPYGCAPLASSSSLKPMSIHVSGPLADYQLKQQPNFSIPPAFNKLKKKDFYLLYDVLMDSHSGKIIWMNALNEEHSTILRWGEQEIKKMTFDHDSHHLFVRGNIELSIQVKENAS